MRRVPERTDIVINRLRRTGADGYYTSKLSAHRRVARARPPARDPPLGRAPAEGAAGARARVRGLVVVRFSRCG